ncbi:energy transducer TonB [Hymenobacter sp. DH14]|uniref:Energy transducer TonB n=1 Tax=Hymenobacter cyanobacteriorum TaxID=2926463 RepID=A0A9X1VHD4_9BACT|nr:energy transducer TonB [Hymenobacter cyanobacteriorum]MCI1186935.1 energy transducer TonB [Hymenobacter cyanobacteriorum]
MSTTLLVFFLFLVILGPPVAILALGLRFHKLSHVAGLTGRARRIRLVWLAVLAAALTGSFYLLVCIVSAKLPGAHAPARSNWPWLHEHPATTVLLAALGMTLLLVAQPAKRLAGFGFGAGALVVLTGLGIHWFLTDHQEDVKLNAAWHLRQADVAYRETGARRAVLDSFQLQLPRCHHKDELELMPEFPGGYRALDEQIRRLMRPTAPHPPVDTYVQVECIVEPTGQLTFPHVVEGLGPDYDEEALRIVRLLPPFEPAIGRPTETRARQPLACTKQISVSFYH